MLRVAEAVAALVILYLMLSSSFPLRALEVTFTSVNDREGRSLSIVIVRSGEVLTTKEGQAVAPHITPEMEPVAKAFSSLGSSQPNKASAFCRIRMS